MMEYPEAHSLGNQLREVLKGKTVSTVEVNHSPHKFAWYSGDSVFYTQSLKGKEYTDVQVYGGQLEVQFEDMCLLLSDGLVLKWLCEGQSVPSKHQLYMTFESGEALVASIQMYGGMFLYQMGTYDNPYYLAAKEKPGILSSAFTRHYFDAVFDQASPKLSLKAFLATEQRFPGIGNGVIQDVLFEAGLHPKRKLIQLSKLQIQKLYDALIQTVSQMVDGGGRNTEKRLDGTFNGYAVKLSKATLGKPCPVCGTLIEKAEYLGGRIYFCPSCQVLE